MTKTNNIKLHIHRLSFEMTRQCNLACAHCARGEAQNAVIKREYIDRVLDQIDYAGRCNGRTTLSPGRNQGTGPTAHKMD